MKRKQTHKHDRERGSTLFILAVAGSTIFLLMGMVIDLGTAYVVRSRISKALDAGALAAARSGSTNDRELRITVLRHANANYLPVGPIEYEVDVRHPWPDATRVTVTGITTSPSYFAWLIGRDKFDIKAASQGTRLPIDMTYLVDVSSILQETSVTSEVESSADNFVQMFSDPVDQVGVVTYSTWAEERMPLQKFFQAPAQTILTNLVPIAFTNIDEALRLGKKQLDEAPVRPKVTPIVMLFNASRPTAYADRHNVLYENSPVFIDAIPAADRRGSAFRGLFHIPDGRRISGFNFGGGFLFDTVYSTGSAPAPAILPGPLPVTGTNILAVAADQAEQWADKIRSGGATIYVVALDNPLAVRSADRPDFDLLRRLANVGGLTNPGQPRGQLMIARNATQLDAVYARMADRIIARLTR